MSGLRALNAAAEYLPIADYAAIGNLRSVALVGKNGSIDWLCLPSLDRPSVFGALLDARRGGCFRVAPARPRTSTPQYRGDTCVLETDFLSEDGRFTVTDWMPLQGTIIGARDPHTAPEIYRLLHGREGEAEVEVEWAPRFDFARAHTRMRREDNCIVASAGGQSMSLAGLPVPGELVETESGPALRARFPLLAGEQVLLVTRYAAVDVAHAADDWHPNADPEHGARCLRETCDAWTAWVSQDKQRPTAEWAGEWAGLVTRSELTLKMLTYPETGAIAAAATTSLPETIGGVRNWDYRYCWVRDSNFLLHALFALSHDAEAFDFLHFIRDASRRDGDPRRVPRLMYDLHGSAEIPEQELEHLHGYRGSRPVRVGNAAADQRQHDALGELVECAYELARNDKPVEQDMLKFVGHSVDRACDAWQKPDAGIWEMRGPPHHYVYSKVMVWTALDRGIWLAEHCGMPGNVAGWRRSRDLLRDLILRRGYNEQVGSFVQRFGADDPDASTLLLPLQGLLPATDPRMLRTIDCVLEHLTENGLVYRYRMDDGLPGKEGAFGACTFWLVDALALSGRVDEAREIFQGMLDRANHVGLYSEEIDPKTGLFLGNFPQAFTHVGLINSALCLAHAEGRPVPERFPLGAAPSPPQQGNGGEVNPLPVPREGAEG